MSSRSFSVTRECKVEIAVQPPRQVGVGQAWPSPIVARTCDARILKQYHDNTRSFIGTLVLTETASAKPASQFLHHGANCSVSPHVLEHMSLVGGGGCGGGKGSGGSAECGGMNVSVGNRNHTGQLLLQSQRPLRREWLYFVFAPVQVNQVGIHHFTFYLTALSTTATMTGGLDGIGKLSESIAYETPRGFTVTADAVPVEAFAPSQEEEALLHELRAARLLPST